VLTAALTLLGACALLARINVHVEGGGHGVDNWGISIPY